METVSILASLAKDLGMTPGWIMLLLVLGYIGRILLRLDKRVGALLAQHEVLVDEYCERNGLAKGHFESLISANLKPRAKSNGVTH